MLTDLTSSVSMLCLNTHLGGSLSDRVDLNMNWNSSITACSYSFITTDSSASDFSEFCWITSKCLIVLQFWSVFIAVHSSITFNVNSFTTCCHFFKNRWWCFCCQSWTVIQLIAQSIWELVTFSQVNFRMRLCS